ncbi:MAG: hypothetical protein QOG35_2023 [Solirubrobacteraceae bacterium]|nr:hypothetical protein [Solirubrobacteraceae bacterium]
MLALLFDIHGNLPALEAVLDDVRSTGARRHLLGGDYAVFGGWPAETIARLDELLEGVTDRRLVFGHYHVAFERTSASGVELVGPGSVGMPLDGDHRAAWALLHDDGRIERRRVAYDHAAGAARVREVAGDAPWGELIAPRIERASLD